MNETVLRSAGTISRVENDPGSRTTPESPVMADHVPWRHHGGRRRSTRREQQERTPVFDPTEECAV
jgi:hypothetical protein